MRCSACRRVVDVGGRVAAAGSGAHWAMYCEVPSKTRGTSFGDRLLALLEDFGITGRIGIADDRFTAWVAAVHNGTESGAGVRQGAGARGGSNQVAYAARPAGPAGGEWIRARPRARCASTRHGRPAGQGADLVGGKVRVVSPEASAALREMAPRGGSATAKVAARRARRGQRAARRLGGVPRAAPACRCSRSRPRSSTCSSRSACARSDEFAALTRADRGAPARGRLPRARRAYEESGHNLRPYAPERRGDLRGAAVGKQRGDAVRQARRRLTAIAQRLALRLAGRARARHPVRDHGDARAGTDRVIPVTAERPVSQASELIELIAAAIGEGPIAKLRVVVAGEAITGGNASGAEADITEPLVDALSAALVEHWHGNAAARTDGSPRSARAAGHEPAMAAQRGRAALRAPRCASATRRGQVAAAESRWSSRRCSEKVKASCAGWEVGEHAGRGHGSSRGTAAVGRGRAGEARPVVDDGSLCRRTSKAQLREQLTAAIKAKDLPTANLIRMINTKIMERRTAKGFSGTVDDALILDVIATYKKSMEKARAEYFAAGDRGKDQGRRDRRRARLVAASSCRRRRARPSCAKRSPRRWPSCPPAIPRWPVGSSG